MTERQPDPLYDALRDRLANYGQEPPAPLWAGIRAQLPPPVAQPRLRKRRQRAALVLGLILAVVAAASWSLWHKAGPGRRGVASHGHGARPASSQIAARVAPAYPATQPAIEPADAPSTHAVASALPSTSAVLSGSAGAAGAGSTASAEEITSEIDAAQGTVASSKTLGKATGSQKSGRTFGLFSVPTSGRKAGQPDQIDQRRRGASHRAWAAVLPRAELAQSSRTYSAASAPSPRASVAGAPTFSAARAAVTSPGKAWPVAAQSPTAAAGSAQAGNFAEAAGQPATGAGPTSAGLTASNSRMELRTVELRPVGFAALQRQLPADTLLPGPAVVGRRWAVQVTAGPALTYRRLASGTDAAMAASQTNSTFAADARLAEAAEKPSAGFGAQVQLRRVLNGRWSLSSGLGFQEYAVERTYDVAGPVAVVLPSTTNPTRIPGYSSFSHRDTYRFLTVPLHLSYQLGQTSRLRYALLGGADAALYVGGTSPGPGETLQSWGPANSPNHSLSLAISAGLDLRYRVGSRLELVAQPIASYFLNSLTQPASGLASRYLAGTGVLLGAAYSWK